MTSDSSAPAGWLRRALVLAAAFLAAKGAVVALQVAGGGGRGLLSPWAPLALLFEDVWLIGGLAAVDGGLGWLLAARSRARRRVDRAAWALAAALVVWSAVNVPVAGVFGTPLTWPMLGAAGGALADSVRTYVTAANVAAAASVVLAAALAFRLSRRPPGRPAVITFALVAAVIAVAGRPAVGAVETLNLHRNAAVALVHTALRTGEAAPAEADQALSAALAPEGEALDLTHLRGAARGRNVLWVILESTGASYLGAWGAAPDPTPNLTRLASGGLVFENVSAVYPESIKGLFSMLCATAPAPHTEAAQYDAASVPAACLAERLAALGYHTGLFHSGRFAYLGMRHVIEDRGFHLLEDADVIGGAFASSFGTDDLSTARRVLRFVDEAPPDQPWLAVYMPIAGHHPYRSPGDGPRPFPATTEREHYLNDLFAGDAALGTLLDGLEARGVLGETLVVVVGDHGQAFHQHEGNFAHSLFVFEENLHVPLIVAAPGVLPRGLRAPQVGSLLDVAPTLLDVLGVESPSWWDGRSLLEPERRVVRVFTDYGQLQLGLRHGDWKAIFEPETGRARLFHLGRDPGEEINLAEREPRRLEAYRAEVTRWAVAQRERITDYRRRVRSAR